MSIRLIVNADDYGRTAAVSRGVRAAHRAGIVTSTTCMMNMPSAADDLRAALEETPGLGLGVHLVLTAGQPLLPPVQVPSLVALDGAFHRVEHFLMRLEQIDAAQAKAEWRAQIEKFVLVTGRSPTHLDSHHHASYLTEALLRSMLELASEYGCGIRQVIAQGSASDLADLPAGTWADMQEFSPRLLAEFHPPMPDVFYASFYAKSATREHLLSLISAFAPGSAEIMCHPGYVDGDLLAGSSYARQREPELGVLTDPAIRQAIQARGIELISFISLSR